MVNAEEVLDPRALSLEELRALRSRMQMEDDEVSYVRRVAQARVDLVRAELHRRDRGESTDDLSSELRVVLSTHLTGARRARSITSVTTCCPTSSTTCAPKTGSAGSSS
jgi:hypothetical protein